MKLPRDRATRGAPPKDPGPPEYVHFGPDGCMFESVSSLATRIDAIVRDLLAMRWSPLGATPKDLAAWLTQFPDVALAFPLRERWALYGEIWHWPGVPVSTAAENTVKRAAQHDRAAAVSQVTMWGNGGSISWPDDSGPADPAKVKAWIESATRQFNMPDYAGGPAIVSDPLGGHGG